MNAVIRKLGLWLWQLLPANPILVRVVYGASRRPRHLWLRTGYLSALLLVVLSMLAASMSGENASLSDLAKGASTTFKWASYAQLAMMCLLAPVFTAAAITQERDAQTFNILLSTPLTNAQIVFGSLISRLYFVLLLLVAGLPIFLMTMVYGGVTRSQVLESFMLSGSTAILTGALAIFIAMSGVGTRRTIFSFYMAIALYLLAVFFIGRWSQTWLDESPPNIDGIRMSWLAPLHPFLALEVSLNRIQAPPAGHLIGYSSLTRWAMAQPSAAYVTWTLLAAFALTTFSVLFVRRGAKTGETSRIGDLLARLKIRRSGSVTRAPRNVWANPVAWREAKTRDSSGSLLRWCIIIGGLVISGYIFVDYLAGKLTTGEVRSYLAVVIIVQFAIAMIIATNTAATSMTKEKESKTMDILLTTPVTSRYILWGKLRGLVSFAIPLIAGPVLVMVVFAIYGLLRSDAGAPSSPPAVWIESGAVIGSLMVIYTSVACIIGLRISLVSRKNMTAVLYSVGTVIALFGFLSLIGDNIAEKAGGEFGAFLAPFSPYSAIHFQADPATLFDTTKEFVNGAGRVRIAGIIGSVIAVIVWGIVVYTFYAGLVRNFDMIVRKQSGT